MSSQVRIYGKRYCSFCSQEKTKTLAEYDGKTRQGPWAYMCEEHFKVWGIGLGTGRGQRLIYS